MAGGLRRVADVERRGAVLVHGVDFTSRPWRGKPITVATGRVAGGAFRLDTVDALHDFEAFEAWLRRPGPWVAGFDFPFGLPRAAVEALGWPREWKALTAHCAAIGREAFREALDAYRAARPVGDKYPYRRGDAAAGAHSPIKLVHPPVALMFLEGAPRLADAGVHVPGIVGGDGARVALEAYPGYAARHLLGTRARVSYKNDAPAKQTGAHRQARLALLRAVTAADTPFGVRLAATPSIERLLIEDGQGDALDAVICALQAAWAHARRDRGWGLPPHVDPLEGWIVSVPG